MNRSLPISLALVVLVQANLVVAESPIPRPEHPRPDAVRAHWANLNGAWGFRFDPKDEGLGQGWEKPGAAGFDRTIMVPFPWQSELSGIHQVKDSPRIGWYRRKLRIPADFPSGDRVWLRFEAVDWRADVWLNGRKVAEHEGGYTPFSADVTDALDRSAENTLVVRAFDPTDPELPTGKQVGWYTPTSGVWQTVWLESRPKAHIAGFRITPKIDPAQAVFQVELAGAEGAYQVVVRGHDRGVQGKPAAVEPGKNSCQVVCAVAEPRLWTPESPNLYDATIELKDAAGTLVDAVDTYFGLRTISRGVYPGAPYERILLNGKPVFLRAALDQSFNPKGIYTAPDDDFLKRDIIIAKEMGLNGLRIHIKPDEPRRLYWADKIGLLILEDMPNTWRQSPRARAAWEQTMREVVARDRNHPGIIAWVAFNETWGLGRAEDYKKDKDTQAWVSRMVDEIRALDQGERLVEDNSPCNYDHIAAGDLNSWHFYIDNHDQARRHIADVVAKTKPGAEFNYCPGTKQTNLPLINSEYGAVSAGGGDRDISWGLRDLTTQLRRHPKIQGFVYTELADIEWEHNGLVNYDRTPKAFGYDAWLPDMRPNELMGADFIGYDTPPAIVAKPGEKVRIPLFVSHFSDRAHPVKLRYWVSGFDSRADIRMVVQPKSIPITWRAYDVVELEPLEIVAPRYPFVGAVLITLRDPENRRFAANFVNLVVKPLKPLPRVERRNDHDALVRFSPGDFAKTSWNQEGKPRPDKVSGHGGGFFEYRIQVPAAIARAHPESFYYLFEASSKANRERVDWPERVNRQDNPQTDLARSWPSTLSVMVNGREIERITLPDDPADARGVLSHLKGLDHGSHGELVDGMVKLTEQDRAALEAGEPLVLRLRIPPDAEHKGGLCLFGADSGELPLDPSLEFHTRDAMPADLGVDPAEPAARPTGP